MSDRKIGIAMPSTATDGSGRPRPFSDILRDVLDAEALGFDSVWVADHLFIEQAAGQRRAMPEALTLLSALAATTSRIQLGTLVACQALRHPGLLAKAASTVSDISGGRFILGIGAGWHAPEYRAFGLPFDHRVSRFSEYVAILSSLLREGRSTFHGQYFQTADASLPGAVNTPIWIAASGPRMLEITATWADGWNSAWYGTNVSQFAEDLARLQAVRAARGSTRPFTASAGILAIPARSQREADAVWDQLLSLPALRGTAQDELAGRLVVAAPSDAARILTSYWDAGAGHLIVSPGAAPFSAWGPDSIRILGEEVLPQLSR